MQRTSRYRHTPEALCEQMNIARRLIAHRGRATLVAKTTRLPWSLVADLYRDIHSASPPRGQTRKSACHLIGTRHGHMVSSIFAVRYIAIAGRAPRTVTAQHWLQAYEEWQAITPPKMHAALSVNDAWRIAEDLRIGAWSDPHAHGAAILQECGACGHRYLLSAEALLRRDCPFCSLLASPHSWRDGRPRTERLLYVCER